MPGTKHRPQTARRARPAPAQNGRELEPIVAAFGYHYTVDFGPDVRPRAQPRLDGVHVVQKDRSCRCEQGRECPAVAAVENYLRNGGARAPDPPGNYWEVVPRACPVCNGPVVGDHRLDSRRNGCGWRCKSDATHFWEAKLGAARDWFFREWIIPPLYNTHGKRLYPGVHRKTYHTLRGVPFGYLPEANR